MKFLPMVPKRPAFLNIIKEVSDTWLTESTEPLEPWLMILDLFYLIGLRGISIFAVWDVMHRANIIQVVNASGHLVIGYMLDIWLTGTNHCDWVVDIEFVRLTYLIDDLNKY